MTDLVKENYRVVREVGYISRSNLATGTATAFQ
jgi:hypothetical protein